MFKPSIFRPDPPGPAHFANSTYSNGYLYNIIIHSTSHIFFFYPLIDLSIKHFLLTIPHNHVNDEHETTAIEKINRMSTLTTLHESYSLSGTKTSTTQITQ